MVVTRKKKQTNPPQKTTGMPKRIVWLLFAGLWGFLAAAFFSYAPTDWPGHVAYSAGYDPSQVYNWCGPAGAWVAYQGYLMFGPGIWIMLIGWLSALWIIATGQKIADLPIRATGFIIMAIAMSGFVALEAPNAGAMPEGSGGLVAIWFTGKLFIHFANLGSFMILLAIFGIGAIVAVDELVMFLPGAMVAAVAKVGRVRLPQLAMPSLNPVNLFRSSRSSDTAMLKPKPGSVEIRHGSKLLDEEEVEEVEAYEGDADLADHELAEDEEYEYIEYEEGDPDALAEDEEYEYEYEYEEVDEEDEVEVAEDNPKFDIDALRKKISKLPIKIASANTAKAPPPPQIQDLTGYQFPTMDLLDEPESNFTDEMSRLVREQAEILERSLNTYRIEAEVVAIDAGPVITLYEVQLAPGTKVNQVNSVSSDIARELKAQNIRVVPNTAGKSTVGIEVPNLKKEIVRLKDLMALGGEKIYKNMTLPMFLGKDASGAPLIADLAKMPHMLIAGTTGSGKSVCINSIIMSFLFHNKPDELKLILVDPKMVEMAQFKDIPHLMCPVVTEMGRASAILEWAVGKMDERYALLAEAGVRDIDSYNNLDWEELKEIFDPQNEEEEARVVKKIPRLVFVVDELADLMMTNKEVESFIVRIAQKARAVGIHLILATQRPSANVVTGLIKSNMPCRVSFKVASGMDSRIVLDSKGAELLLGHGDMLYLSPRTSKLLRAQGTFVSDKEVRKAVRFLKEFATPSFEPQLMQLKETTVASESDSDPRDPLFEDAVRVVLETQRGSVSLLQRRLAIGYSRSSRLIEEIAEAGLIGSYKGSQAREVMMTLEEWDALQDQASAVNASNAAEDDALNDDVPDEYDGEYMN